MKTNQFTASLFTDLDGKNHVFNYSSVEDLLHQVYDFFNDNEDYLRDDDNSITLDNGEVLTWCHTAANYHFNKGVIDLDKFIETLKGGEL